MKSLILMLCFVSVVFAGCSFLDKNFVPIYDESGNEIGRQPTEIVEAVADTVPYGNVALNVALLLFAGVAKFKQYKTEKGLKSTVIAIKRASEDEDLAEAMDKVKEAYLRPAHESSGAISLIKLLLAKV